MRNSDSIYHRLFSHPLLVEEIVREFVPEELTAGLDFSGLQRVNAKFHIKRDSANRREGDVIWRLPTRAGAEIYFYLLFEFQSKIDWWMALRTQVYQGLLWQHVINEKNLQRPQRLPPVLLLVLYNGEARWNAPSTLSELIDLSSNSSLWQWQPQARYYLLDVGTFDGMDLKKRESLVALLFRLEQSHPSVEVERLIDEVIKWFREHPELSQLKRVFGELVLQATRSVGGRLLVHHNLSEKKSMFATIGERWRRECLAEGKALGRVEGKAEGKAEGKTEGKAENLLRLLTVRFGVLPTSLRRRIRKADLASLDRWFDRAIEASDLSSVFGRYPRIRLAKDNPPRAA